MRHHLNDHLLGAGLISPAQPCALRAQRMFEHHQVPLSVAEELVRASYYHGARNPNAVSYGKELDIDAYRTASWTVEPFPQFDYPRENAGAGAFLPVSGGRLGASRGG